MCVRIQSATIKKRSVAHVAAATCNQAGDASLFTLFLLRKASLWFVSFSPRALPPLARERAYFPKAASRHDRGIIIGEISTVSRFAGSHFLRVPRRRTRHSLFSRCLFLPRRSHGEKFPPRNRARAETALLRTQPDPGNNAGAIVPGNKPSEIVSNKSTLMLVTCAYLTRENFKHKLHRGVNCIISVVKTNSFLAISA